MKKYNVVNSNVVLFIILRCESFSAFWYRGDVFISHDDIYYDYNDFLISILSSILSKSTYLIKIQILFNNYVYLKNILLSEWLDKQISN